MELQLLGIEERSLSIYNTLARSSEHTTVSTRPRVSEGVRLARHCGLN